MTFKKLSVSHIVAKPIAKLASICVIGVAAFSLPNAALAESTQLQAFDGHISVHGTVMNYDGATYKVDTIIGVIWVDASVFSCHGTMCPPKVDTGVRSAGKMDRFRSRSVKN